MVGSGKFSEVGISHLTVPYGAGPIHGSERELVRPKIMARVLCNRCKQVHSSFRSTVLTYYEAHERTLSDGARSVLSLC